MLAAFVVMMGVCVTGWFGFVGTPEIGNAELFDLVGSTLASQPWLVIGVAGVAAIQLLTLLRRAMKVTGGTREDLPALGKGL
jgi:hypothetical protein